MSRSRCTTLPLLAALALLLPAGAAGQVAVGQVDTFEDGTTQGWLINLLGMGAPPPAAIPVNVPTGGPDGVDDNYLRVTSVGGLGGGSRLSVINIGQWAGDYVAQGIGAIGMSVINLGTTDLYLRLLLSDAVPGPPSNVAVSDVGIHVPVGSGWMDVVFPVLPGNLRAELGTVAAALADVGEVRIYHGPEPILPGPTFPPPPLPAQLGIDDITAIAAVPEPATVALLAGGLALLLLRRRPRARRVG